MGEILKIIKHNVPTTGVKTNAISRAIEKHNVTTTGVKTNDDILSIINDFEMKPILQALHSMYRMIVNDCQIQHSLVLPSLNLFF